MDTLQYRLCNFGGSVLSLSVIAPEKWVCKDSLCYCKNYVICSVVQVLISFWTALFLLRICDSESHHWFLKWLKQRTRFAMLFFWIQTVSVSSLIMCGMFQLMIKKNKQCYNSLYVTEFVANLYVLYEKFSQSDHVRDLGIWFWSISGAGCLRIPRGLKRNFDFNVTANITNSWFLKPDFVSLEHFRNQNSTVFKKIYILCLSGRRNKENAQIQISFNAKTIE